MTDEKVMLTADQAVAMLPDKDWIHTFVNPAAGMLLGADWTREYTLEAIRASTHIELTGPTAASMGHRFVIEHMGRAVYIESNPEPAP